MAFKSSVASAWQELGTEWIPMNIESGRREQMCGTSSDPGLVFFHDLYPTFHSCLSGVDFAQVYPWGYLTHLRRLE